MAEEKEMIKHLVKLDDFMMLEWMIPRVITPMELKAMTFKINKLFNIAEVQIVDDERHVNANSTKAKDTKQITTINRWDNDSISMLMELYNQGLTNSVISERLIAKTGSNYFRIDTINNKIQYMRKKGQLNRTSRNNVNGTKKVRQKRGTFKQIFTEDIVTELKKEYAQGVRGQLLAQNLSNMFLVAITSKQVSDRVKYMKIKGEL